MSNLFYQKLAHELHAMQQAHLYKTEHAIEGAQGVEIKIAGRTLLNFCANNYLGLANHSVLKQAASDALDQFGFGLSSVRFICGTQTLHLALEQKIADFVGCEDAILYAAAFDANGGLFEPLWGEEDAIISDALNHASIIDGIRLCKAKRYRYQNNDMLDLESKIIQARADSARHIVIASDGVFSMDGIIAQVDKIVALAKKYGCITMIDDCHASGFMGDRGRGTAELCGVYGQVDIITGTLGKALGGAIGGFTAGKKVVVDYLRQRSRPYLFSNALPPSVVNAGIAALNMLSLDTHLCQKLQENTRYFRQKMKDAAFDMIESTHPICAIMLYDAARAQQFAQALFDKGIYVKGFFYPVVPEGKARIRVQISAAHDKHHLDAAIQAFSEVKASLELV